MGSNDLTVCVAESHTQQGLALVWPALLLARRPGDRPHDKICFSAVWRWKIVMGGEPQRGTPPDSALNKDTRQRDARGLFSLR